MAEELLALVLYKLLHKPDSPFFPGITKEGIRPQGLKLQASTPLNQANPVSGTWYTVMNEKAEAIRLYEVIVMVNTVGEGLQARITIDGVVTLPDGENCAADTPYYADLLSVYVGTVPYTTIQTTRINKAFIIEGKEITIELRKTGNNGNGNLRCNYIWSKIP